MSKHKKTADNSKEKRTPGAILAEEMRSRANNLTDAERESLMAFAMRTIYGKKRNAADARRS